MTGSNNVKNLSDINKPYLIIVSVLTFVLPVIGFIAEHLKDEIDLTFTLYGKWFVFSAAGLRLFLAGVRQVTKPAFTAREIFHIYSPDVLPIVRELGFANICIGLVGIISLLKPEWRTVSAFASGLYYGLAALLHLVKKPAGINEQFAFWTDLLIFVVLTFYFFVTI